MVVFKRKTRMLSFRLSEDEYECLKINSLADGARSISDYARTMLFRVVRGDPPPSGNGLEVKMEKLHADVQELSRELHRLREFVGFDGPPCTQ